MDRLSMDEVKRNNWKRYTEYKKERRVLIWFCVVGLSVLAGVTFLMWELGKWIFN